MVKTSLNLFLSAMFISFSAFSQDKVVEALTTDNQWSSGSILTTDGKELKGTVKYDEQLGVLNYDDGNDSRTFAPRHVTAFEFFDEPAQKQRLFLSLEYEDPDKGLRTQFFFEVLKDFKNFAVLSKTDPAVITARNTNTGPGYNPATGTTSPGFVVSTGNDITHIETIYFLGEEGQIEPYIKVTKKIIDRMTFDGERNKSKVLDKHVISKYFTQEELDKMKEYADKNDLSFRAKDDLIKILSFCEELRTKK